MTATPTTPDLLTMDEAAERLGMSARNVRRLVAERKIGHYRLGRSIRLAPADLAAYLAAGRVDPTDDQA